MARIWMKPLAAAAILASAVPAWAQSPDVGTSAQISEVLNNNENKEAGSTIFLDDVLIKSQIGEQLNKAIKDERLAKLVDFYWEDEAKSRINEMIDEIFKNLNEYWRFDSNWNFDLFDGDWSLIFKNQWESLFESKFREYNKYKNEHTLLNIVSVIAGICCSGRVITQEYYKTRKKRNNKLEEENDRLREEN